MSVSPAALLTTPQYEKTQYLRCNTYGHAWDDYDNSDWVPSFGDRMVLRCVRCGTERRDALDYHGNLIPGGRHYKYPPGYKYAKGERPSRAEFRRMLLLQKVEEQRARRKNR